MKQPHLRRRSAALGLMALAMSGRALAADVPKPEGPPPAATPLSGVVVTAPSKDPPAVVGVYPAPGSEIRPGAVVLKITFSQRMNPDAWRFDRGADGYPQCLARPRLLTDEKTFVLLCTVGGGGRYSVALNGVGDGGFVNLAGQRATPFELRFSTTTGASVDTIQDALKAASLKPEDDPVMDKRPAATVTASTAPTP